MGGDDEDELVDEDTLLTEEDKARPAGAPAAESESHFCPLNRSGFWVDWIGLWMDRFMGFSIDTSAGALVRCICCEVMISHMARPNMQFSVC